MADIQVDNETQAIRLLRDALEGRFDNRNVALTFENWPVLSIRLVGKGYDSTITADIAEALVEVQNAVNRSYARFVHGTGNARTLTAEERRGIKFKAKVHRGSSLIEINLGEFATKLSNELVGKMDSTQLMVTVLGLAVVGAGTLAYKWYLKEQAEGKKVDSETQRAVALSEQETRRLEVVTRALASQPRLKDSREDFNDARHEMLKGVGDAKTLSINGIELDNAAARKIAATPRSSSEDVQLNDSYIIKKIDWQLEDDVKLTVVSADGNRVFVASLSQSTLREEHKEILKSAEWDRKPIHLSINATVLRGEVTTARIVSVGWPKKGNGASGRGTHA